MTKVSLVNADGSPKKGNDYCPQAPFIFGTYKDDGKPNFGMFNWLSYCWDGECHVMCGIGGEKLTKDRIHATGVFSANLVTEKLVPLADWFGNHSGNETDKALANVKIERGSLLNVPTLADSPWTYELEVKHSIPLDDGEIFVCRIANILADERLTDENVSVDERFKLVRSALVAGVGRYYGVNSTPLGKWGDWRDAKL